MNEKRTGKTLYVVVLPLIAVFSLALGGCGRDVIEEQVSAGGVYLSKSAGANFDQSATRVDEGNIASFDLGQIHRSPNDSNTVFMGAGENGMAISRDDGQSWNVVPTGIAATIDVAMFKNNMLLASGYDASAQGVVMQSLDGGVSWQNVFTIPRSEEAKRFQIIGGGPAVPIGVSSLLVDTKQEGRLYAGTNDGTLFIAEQYGKTWRKAVELGSTSEAITGSRESSGIVRMMIPAGDFAELLMLTEDKRLLMLKGGAVEEMKVPQSLNEPSALGIVLSTRKVLSIAPVFGFPDALLIGTASGVVLTRDAGKTFIELNLPFDSTREITRMIVAVSPSNANRIFVVADGIVYRSEDNGLTWHTTSVGPVGFTITDFSINPSNASRVLAILKALAA